MKTPRFMMTLLATAAMVITLTQCGSDDPTPVKQTDVYVAGEFNTLTAPQYNWVPVYWKNGEMVQLSESNGSAKGIAVIGNDVYVIGKLNDSDSKLRLWTNGVQSDLTDGTDNAYIYNMKVIGNDWYALGYTFKSGVGVRPVYWKNGDIHVINAPSESYAFDIAVDGADVYVAGRGIHASGYNMAKVWKNDVVTDLSDGTSHVGAYGVAVLNGDVYVTGQDNQTLVMWKNGVASNIGTVDESGTSYGSISIVNGDIYIAGYDNGAAKYWKNGVANVMTKPAGASETYAYSLVTQGKDIFVFGEGEFDNNWSTLVWKNNGLAEGFNGANAFHAYAMSVALAK